MKKYLFLLMLALICTDLSAKKVRFAVDMSGLDINPAGVFVSGDFQTIAGFPGGDWQPNTTSLKKEDNTDIYSTVLDLPAFAKYEYKFLNGDQWYDVEFVPLESRVGYELNDSRWIWVDSLANDTTSTGAVLFSANAPNGMKLARLLVDMDETASISTEGIHLTGSFQGWNPVSNRLYNFTKKIYETIIYLVPGTYEYKFINGSKISDSEVLSGECAVNENRQIVIQGDTVLQSVCFSKCSSCNTSSVSTETGYECYSYPNPAESHAAIGLGQEGSYNIQVSDPSGRILDSWHEYRGSELRIETDRYTPGVYFVKSLNLNNNAIIVNKFQVK